MSIAAPTHRHISAWPAALAPARFIPRTATWRIGVTTGVFFLLMALWQGLVIQDIPGDAISRTYSAFMAVHSVEPHLATLGFIWPPLPALAQVPIVGFFPQLGYLGFAGRLVTVVASGIVAATVYGLLVDMGIPRVTAVPLVVLLMLNPMMLFYGVNAMSEMTFLAFFLLSLRYFLGWSRTRHWQSLVATSICSAGMLLCRYDGIVVAASFGLGVIAVMMEGRRTFSPPRLEAHVLAYATPIAYMVSLWMYFNWTIMGDPLYFWHSEYSNLFLTRAMQDDQTVKELQRSIPATIAYAWRVVTQFSPLFTASVVVGSVYAMVRRDGVLITVIMSIAAAPLFQYYSFRSGSTFDLMRFYVSVIPGGLVLGALVLRKLVPDRANLILWLLVVGSLIGIATSAYSMATEGPDTVADDDHLRQSHFRGDTDEHRFIQTFIQPTTPMNRFVDDQAAAAYLVTHACGRSILIDSAGSTVALATLHPELFYLVSDSDWKVTAANPRGKVHYIVSVVRPNSPEYHAFLDVFPNLHERGTPFTTLEAEFGTIRIYAVTGAAACS